MPSPFPGMDPYLEAREHWPSFHHLLADEIMAQLNRTLSERYYASVEVRTLLEEVTVSTVHTVVPDIGVLEAEPHTTGTTAVTTQPAAPIQRLAMPLEQIRLRSVHVYTTGTHTLVTSIEMLSPVNKGGEGLEAYRLKRDRILRSPVHLIEIDLLRGQQRPGWEVNEPPIDTDYILLVNRARLGQDRISDIWPVALNQPLPQIPVPLLEPDPDITLDLSSAVSVVYERAAYARRIDYTQPVPPPKLRPDMAAWLATIQ
ncbi:MAG: hypothetical protein ETSY1_27405 [Candidatus Entotheonella factor]|uniref:DUF4058 domain-containing protein n=1 Tax=Entotheonella factor TaxID=1429438 RepID=W4LE21_ENTF1|nr:MAG: hypothetical protein ETSY1_27405 [Candidatus Entotheonella factor]